jgi:GNAT superfamily N-acetyltransferase
MNCHCGEVFSENDTATLVEPVFLHFDATHPELELSRVSVRNYLDAEDRATGSVVPVPRIDQVEVVPIAPSIADEIIDFFDRDAFPDNPAWGSCYCMFYFLGGMANSDWGHVPWQETRQAQLDRLHGGATTGTIARIGDRIVGWCNATSRSEFPSRVTGVNDDAVCSVVCFVIAPPHRGHGLAKLLLAGAVDHARRTGFREVEAYPRSEPKDAASSYVGALSMYLDAGFRIKSDDPLVVGLEL